MRSLGCGISELTAEFAEVVPDYIDCVTIVADANETGLNNAKKLAHGLKERGLYVEVKTPEQN